MKPVATPSAESFPARLNVASVVGWSVGLTLLFWWPLWLGFGLIGGDIYTYSLPQKVFLADALADGELPLWNHLVGLGYPILAESQTGVFYPLHWLCYGLLDVQTAANVVMLVHYVLAFAGAWWCGCQLALTRWGALLLAVVYVYGWFPARSSLDWAILGGAYLPLMIGCAEAWWRTQQPGYGLGLAMATGLQLLGGHYQLAFYSWLLLAAYGGWRIIPEWRTIRLAAVTDVDAARRNLLRRVVIIMAAFGLGVGLAAVQLGPTWELKSRSQRTQAGGDYDPGYGHIPPLYLTQVFVPWIWYDPAIDQDAALARLTWLATPHATNRVEAHVYFGQLPLYLALAAFVSSIRFPTPSRGAIWFWSAVVVVSLLMATGWPTEWLPGLPGFSYFRGPGRAGLVATFAVGWLAGRQLDRWLNATTSLRRKQVVRLAVVLLTVAEFWRCSNLVTYAVMIPLPPIVFRDQSDVARLLREESQPVRLYAPGANLPTLMNVSMVPVYLGLGPREYFDPLNTFPPAEPEGFATLTPERLNWLYRAGVTHILSFEPLEQRGWPVEHLWVGFDRLLNRAWGRYEEPVFLYRLLNAPGRAVWKAASGSAEIKVTSLTRHRVVIEVTADAPGQLILRDLPYPGWVATVDGQTVASTIVDGMSRAVDVPAGRHQVVWSYRPLVVYWGAAVSGLAGLLLAAGVWRLRARALSGPHPAS